MPTIGVLITYYNEAELLTECLNSLLNGSELPDEILIYDDASEIPPEPYVPANAKVSIIHGTKNAGPAHGRNELMRVSTSEYIHCHDSDDLFHSEWCKKVRNALHKHAPDILLHELNLFNQMGTFRTASLGLQNLVHENDLLKFAINGILPIPSTTYRRALGLQIGGYQTRNVLPLAEDIDFHIRLANFSNNYIFIEEPLTFVRMRSNSNSRDNNGEKKECWICAIKSFSLLAEKLPSEYAPLLAEKGADYSAKLYRMGYNQEAIWGFQTSSSIARLKYDNQSGWYRFVARAFGPIFAERLGAKYRSILPVTLRRKLHWGTTSN